MVSNYFVGSGLAAVSLGCGYQLFRWEWVSNCFVGSGLGAVSLGLG